MKIDELLIGLGFDYDPKGLDKFSENIDAAKKTAMKMGKALLGVQAAVTALVTVSTKATDQQAKLAAEIGTTTEMLDGLMFAASRAGVDNLGSSLQDLAVRAAEAARGTGSGVEALSMLGVSATDSSGNLKDISSLMIEISGSMQGLDNLKQIELADKLGLRSSIKLLQRGPKEIRALVAEAGAIGVATKEDAAIAERYQDSLTDITKVTSSLSRIISRTLAPVMSEMAESMVDWWKANRELIEQNMESWINTVSTAIKLLTIAGGAFIALKLAKGVIGLASAFKSLAGASALASGAMAIVPFLIVGAIAALILAIQDAQTFFEGGDSFFGDAIKDSDAWRDSLLNVAAVLATIGDTIGMIAEGWGYISNAFEKASWENAQEVAKNIPGFISDATGLQTIEGDGLLQRGAFKEWNLFLSQSIKKLTESVSLSDSSEKENKSGGELFDGMSRTNNSKSEEGAGLFDGIKKSFGDISSFLGNEAGLYAQDGVGLLQEMERNTQINKALMSSGLERLTGRPRLQSGNTNIDKIDININGGADTAENIGRAVVNELQQATQELSTAVDQ